MQWSTGSDAAEVARAARPSFFPEFSPDGSRILFTSYAPDLVPGDTNGGSDANFTDVFVKTLATGAIERVSTDKDGQEQVDGHARDPMWSPDGMRILFTSEASNLVPGDTNRSATADYIDGVDVFVKTLATGAIERVSTDKDGSQVSASSFHPTFSPIGTQVAFESQSTELVSGDPPHWSDIFVKTLTTGAIARVSTDKDGQPGDLHSMFPLFTPDGTGILFTSLASNLVPGDTNGTGDLFIKSLR